MKNNKGFATSFILFSLLVLFLLVMSIVLFTLNSSSVLNSKIKTKIEDDITTPKTYEEFKYKYIGKEQVFTAKKDRIYTVQAWSSSGNYITGKINLKKGDKLYLFIGKTSAYNNGNTDIRTQYSAVDDTTYNIMRSGYNLNDSNVFNNRFTDVEKNNTTPSLGSANEGYVKIYYSNVSNGS